LKASGPPYGLVYKITCLVSGKSYIGVTIRKLKRRWQAHLLSVGNGKGHAIHAAIAKYGKNQFVIEEVACAIDRNSLMIAEREIISQENTISPNGYNLTAGGEGMFAPSAETRLKKRNALLGKKQSLELIEKRIASRRGQPRDRAAVEQSRLKQLGTKRKSWGRHTQESILKMKEKCKGRRPSPATTQAAIAALTGRPQSIDSKIKRSVSLKAFYASNEGKALATLRASQNKGRVVSSETSLKISRALRGKVKRIRGKCSSSPAQLSLW